MSQTANTLATLNGMFKEAYADKIQQLIPDGVKLLNKIEFMSKDKQPGNSFHMPIVLGLEHGITFGSSEDDYFNLNPPISGVMKEALVKGHPAILRSAIGYTSASRAAQGDKQAFMGATKHVVANMLRSITKKLEIELLYGNMGYAKVSAVAGAVVTITTAEWAPGIWVGAENMPIEIRDATGATSRGIFQVSSVDLDLRTVTLDSSAAAAGVIATDIIWHKGAYEKEFNGIHKILTTTSGTLFNINVGQFNLFKGNSYSAASAALSFAKVNSAAAKAVEKGLDGKLLCLVNPRTWANLLNDLAALRKYDQSYSAAEMKQGSQGIKFFSQNGEIEIEPSIYVKEGYAYLLAIDEFSRVGSSDVTFRLPGSGEEFFRHSTDASGYELRAFTDQSLFCMAPGKSVIITDVVNS